MHVPLLAFFILFHRKLFLSFFHARTSSSSAIKVIIVLTATQTSNETPNHAREWVPVGQSGIPYWYHRAAKIEESTQSDRNQGDEGDIFVDIQDGIDEAQEKK
jgi:hypothetical protein